MDEILRKILEFIQQHNTVPDAWFVGKSDFESLKKEAINKFGTNYLGNDLYVMIAGVRVYSNGD